MTTSRKFGVDDPDEYWRERVRAGRTKEHRLHKLIVELIQQRFPEGGTVLDCGVGDGHVFRLARERYQTYGVEFSREAISRYEFPTETIAHADLNHGIPAFDIRFDAIVLSMVLHWLDDPEGFLRGAKAHLTPRGRLFVAVPNVVNYRYRIRFLFGQFPKISLSHKNIMTPREVESLFERAGYQIERLSPTKRGLKHRLWPRLISASLVYVLKPHPN